MDRTKLIERLTQEFNKRGFEQRWLFIEALKRMGDADMIVYANEVGIDTDAMFAEVK